MWISPDATIGKNTKVEHGAVIYEGCVIGDNCIVGANAVLRQRTIIGDNTIIGTLTCTEGDCTIGRDTTIHAQCHITKGVTIGNRVFIAPFFIAANTPNITEGKHGRNPTPDLKILPTVIEDDVRIGACVRMIPGLRVGHHSVLDMDCLLTKDIPPYSHVRGGKDKIGRIQ